MKWFSGLGATVWNEKRASGQLNVGRLSESPRAQSRFSITSPFSIPCGISSPTFPKLLTFLSFLEYFKAGSLYNNKFLMNTLEIVTSLSLSNKRIKREIIICYHSRRGIQRVPITSQISENAPGIPRVGE